jgi:hypothetical protein
MKRSLASIGVGSCLAVVGCGSTVFVPQRLHRGEAYLAYDGHLQVLAHGRVAAEEPGFLGLRELVKCSYEADTQARKARRRGRAAQALAWTGVALGVGSVVSIAGVATLQSNRTVGTALLAGGLSAGGLGIAFGLGSRRERSQAVGHAVDAVNFYNDAIADGRCHRSPPGPRR